MPTNQASEGFGVYVLANDRALDWFIAFCKSFRRFNPAMPLVLVPFDDQIEALRGLKQAFGFEILDSPWFEELEAIGRMFFPDSPVASKMFRRIACFDGPFESFLYVDSDFLVLDDLSPFARLEGDAFVYDGSVDMTAVYKSEALVAEMRERYGAVGFNSGLWRARRGQIPMAGLRDLAARLVERKDEIRAETWDQPFINYIVDVSRLPKRSTDDVFGGPTRVWAKPMDSNLPVAQANPRSLRPGFWTPMAHWAGFKLSPRMPLYRLWRHYRLLDEGPLDRLRFDARMWSALAKRKLAR